MKKDLKYLPSLKYMVIFTKAMLPIEAEEGLKSRISEHFGRAPFFAIIEIRGSEVKLDFIKNPKRLGYTPGEYAVVSGIEYVVVKGGIGVKALEIMKKQGIKVVETHGEFLEDAIKELKSGEPKEYAGEGCPGRNHKNK